MTGKCITCGYKISSSNNFCPNCGEKVHSNNEGNTVDSFNCPLCHKEMTKTHDDGILGGDNFECFDCELKFRELYDGYSLHRSPENTRFNKRYSFESYSKSEWIDMGKGQFSPKEIKEEHAYEYICDTEHICPYCGENLIKSYKQSYLTKLVIYHCNVCKLTFEKSGNKYRFMNSTIHNIPLWNYYHNSLTKEEWESILDHKFDTSINNNPTYPEYTNDDIAIFLENLENNHPLLPRIENPGIILNNNEQILYLLESIQLLRGILGLENNEDRFNRMIPQCTSTLIITNQRIFYKENRDVFEVYYNQITSMEYLNTSLIINTSITDESFVLLNISYNTISFSVNGNSYTVNFTPHMLYNLIKGQVLN